VREGAYWVGSISDSFAIGPQSSLQVNTRGTVVVKRGSGDQVTYRVRQRVRAANEDKARAMLGGGAKQVTRLRGRTVLEVQPISAENVKIDECSDCGGIWLDKGELEQLQRVNRARGVSGGVLSSLFRRR